MAVNGTNLITDPFNTSYSPWTNLFSDLLGDGYGLAFWFVPIIAITLAIYIKTQDYIPTTLFMVSSGALLATGNLFIGNAGSNMWIAFVIFTALGVAGMFIGLLLQRRG